MDNKCHLLEKEPPETALAPIWEKFDNLKVYEEESHVFRYLLKCKFCPQLYFFEFYEEIDWNEGKDSQYVTYIPIKNKEFADEINKLSQFELLQIRPRLQKDFVGDTKTIKWVK